VAPARAATVQVIGNPADGVRALKTILAKGHVRRWPMYLRNVKQMLRESDATFDERAYGFGNLVDLLRAAHKDGVLRVDRDRHGVIRVFQGATFASAPAPATVEPPPDVEPVALVPDVPPLPMDELPDDNVGNRIEVDAPEPAAPKPRRRRASGSSEGARVSRPRRTRKTS
jgi:hypothetical protein